MYIHVNQKYKIMTIKARIEGTALLQVNKYWVDVWVDKVKYRYTEYTNCDRILISYEIRKKDILIKDENINRVIIDYLRKENIVTSHN
jgi:hypothetical protein